MDVHLILVLMAGKHDFGRIAQCLFKSDVEAFFDFLGNRVVAVIIAAAGNGLDEFNNEFAGRFCLGELIRSKFLFSSFL